MTTPLPLVERFQRKRWTMERLQIDAMKRGEVLHFFRSKYFNVKSSVQRLNEAYNGTRRWLLVTHDLESTVTRQL